MNLAFCYESVFPDRGGCETYIADLARRLVADRHHVHLYACRWDTAALPPETVFHLIPPVTGIRFLRPWQFSERCLQAMADERHQVTVGFDKTYGQDLLYPLGGLHSASVDQNFLKFEKPWQRRAARALKWFDLAHWSFVRLQRRQYLGQNPPQIVVNSEMVRGHFKHYLGVPEEEIVVVRSAIDPGRFPQHDRLRVRQEMRQEWGVQPEDTVGLFVAKNYRLKGLVPLLHGLRALVHRPEFVGNMPSLRLLVCGSDDVAGYQKLAKELHVDSYVRFLGSYPAIREAFFAADFLIHPTFYDPCSLVVLEALACDLPVITSRFNGASELIQDGKEGFVIETPHQHEHMGWCMAQMLDPAKRRTLAQNARRAGQRWTFEHHYQELLSIFIDVATRKYAA